MDSANVVIENKTNDCNQKKQIPPNLQKICLVCGDKALGYNFNAISCESCKAFFRRNALASKQFKCPFTNSCEITIVTRRFCQKCRLEKCLAIGMVKEFIMSDEDKAEKRRKIEENRAKKRHSNEPSDDTVSSSKTVKRDEEVPISNFIPPIQDPSLIQYDVLNSTCSPQSTTTIQSPLSNDFDTSLHSEPVYSNFAPMQSMDTPYPKVYPIDEKSVLNRNLYEHRLFDSYTSMCDSLDSAVGYSDSSRQSSIRTLLTTPNGGDTLMSFKDTKLPDHICQELPTTSDDADSNKAKEILQDVERIEPNSMESILCEAIKLEFEGFSNISSCSGSSRELNEVERAKLYELIVANKALHDPVDDDISALDCDNPTTGWKDCEGKQDPRLITIVNLTAMVIRRFIKMAKKINAFKFMCEEDQVALLKGGCIEMMVLISSMSYDRQRNQWMLPHIHEKFGTIRADVLKLAKGNIYVSYEQFIRTFEQKCRTDENVILVMSAILLFTPDRSRVVHKDVIKLEQNSYYYLLRRYLESVYPGCEAKSTFLKLIQKILELRKLATEVTGVYLDVNPIEPLLMEIFDLKHHPA